MFGKKPENIDRKIDKIIEEKLNIFGYEIKQHYQVWRNVDPEILVKGARGVFIFDAKKFEAKDSFPIDLDMNMDVPNAADNYNFFREIQIMRGDAVHIDETKLDALLKKYPLAKQDAKDVYKLLVQQADHQGIEMQEMIKPKK